MPSDADPLAARLDAIREEHARCADGSARAEAVVGTDVFPCTGNHDDGFHHFAFRADQCPAPFCKLANGHRSLHDIPSGKAEYRTRETTDHA